MGKFIKIGIGVVVVLVVAGLFFSGRLKKEDAEQLGRDAYYKTRGAASSVLNPKTAAGDYKSAEICRGNLREIERGKRLVAQEKGVAVGAVNEAEVEKAIGKAIPKCPSGGKYSLMGLESLPVCSIGNCGTVDPKDDHTILSY